MDRLVRYSTGKERAAASTAKYMYALKRQKFRWTAGLTRATDVQYYNHIKLLGQASVATVAMLTNRGKISKLWTPTVSCQTQACACKLRLSAESFNKIKTDKSLLEAFLGNKMGIGSKDHVVKE